ncbi:unnamed protein product [Lactuca virosa]|uniref:Ubiquitin-like protease family profile domain-containing protein n=1 Tax=Lactuca virosa TaxID=75947 RepID=A0AAU9PV87_9ASTR|nr:unnamed protein product [Lactuca virosa]
MEYLSVSEPHPDSLRKQSEHTTVINNKDISINNDMESNLSKSKQSRTKFTSDFYSRKRPNDDDDDFVNPPPVTIPIQKIVKKQTRMANPGKVEDSLRYLNTRFPPEHITKTMALLNNDQRKCVESIGFGSAFNIQLEKLPRRICYWVVDNYDPNTNSICVKDKRLVVTRERVHEIYGIPMGDIPMSNPCRANSRKFVKLWKSQFPKSVKRIRLTHVVDMIQKDKNVGPFFIMNFLVLFVSVMIEYPTMGTVNQGFLENILDDMDIKQLDWCGFVVACLKSSRMMWRRLDDKCVYSGPIVFLLLFYLSCTKVEDATIQSPTAGMMYWTTDMLDKRELEELSKGGFGNVIISSQHMSMNHTKQEDGEDDDAAGSERDCKSHAGFIEHVLQQTSQSENDAYNNLKDIMSEINIEFNACDNAMRAIQKLLMQDFSTSVDSHDGTFFNGAATPVTPVRDNTAETKVDQFTEDQMADEPLIDVVCTPFTQILNADAFDRMLESAFATSTRLSTPSDHVEPNIKIDDVNAVPVTIVAPRRTSRLVVSPVTVVAPRRTRRLVRLTEKLRSPYFNRVVDPNKVLRPIEERVSGWIFAGLDEEWDLVFESTFGDIGYRGIFESMIPGSKIHLTIIDIWATLLNYQELRRNKKSPARMFLSCTLLSNFILDEAICIEQRYKRFVDRMNEHIEKFKQCTSFKDVDLVFFPVLDNEHYYLIVFDFIKSECVIIDNIYREESIEVIYGNVPNDLKILFTLYIDAWNHPRRNSMKSAIIVRSSMEWMTKENYIDCGLFLMKHMETYKGGDPNKWIVGLEPEFADSDDQQIQLNELRKKYVTKILTSDLNIIKPSLNRKLASYNKLSDAEKENLNIEEHLQRIELRISLFY